MSAHSGKTDQSVSFLTLTNKGYYDYTTNLLKSLDLSGTKERLKIYCLDRECYEAFRKKKRDAVLMEALPPQGCREDLSREDIMREMTDFQRYRTGQWHNIVVNKLAMIHQELLKNEYVLIVDGDIVFQHDGVIEYLLNVIEDNDICVQNETVDEDSPGVCSGFMFIRSNNKTIESFSPRNYLHQASEGWGDQEYVQELCNQKKLKFHFLPLDLFPNGRFYYKNYRTIAPWVIHFNWASGHYKKMLMIKHGKWFNWSNVASWQAMLALQRVEAKQFIKRQLRMI